jgi:hypothetical protein
LDKIKKEGLVGRLNRRFALVTGGALASRSGSHAGLGDELGVEISVHR